MDTALTDEKLVVLSLNERAFFGELVVRYEDKLSRYIARLGVRDPEDRLDLLQDIFIKTYRNLHGFDTDLSFSSWIYRIAHNEVVSWYRKRAVRPEGHLIENSNTFIDFIASDKGGELSPEDRAALALQKEALDEALAELDDRYRDVVILRFFEHKDYDEISDILKIPIGTVGTQLHRAKKQLQETLTASKKYE